MSIFLKITASLFFAIYLFEVSAWLGWAVLLFTAGNFWDGFKLGMRTNSLTTEKSVVQTEKSPFMATKENASPDNVLSEKKGNSDLTQLPIIDQNPSDGFYSFNTLLLSIGKEHRKVIAELMQTRYPNKEDYHAKMLEIGFVIRTKSKEEGLKGLIAELENCIKILDLSEIRNTRFDEALLQLKSVYVPQV